MAATSSATSNIYATGVCRGRPLSTIQLISPDKTGEDADEECEEEKQKRDHVNPVGTSHLCQNGRGFENGAFELGSPVATDYTQSTASYQEAKAKLAEQHDKNNERKITETLSTVITKRPSLRSQDSECQRQFSDPSSLCGVKRDGEPCVVVSKASDCIGDLPTRRGDTVRCSWLLDGNVRRRDDAVWRRRNTDPSSDSCTSSSYSYHRDYQEALSSLLWEPYECRQTGDSPKLSTQQVGNSAHEADVSVWLFPGVASTAQSSSSSSSSSSVSSGSSLAVVSADVTTDLWNKAPRDSSSSSLGALIISNSSSRDDSLATSIACGNSSFNGRDKRSEAVDRRSSCDSNTTGNITTDPNQLEDTPTATAAAAAAAAAPCEDAVGDLHTRWAVTAPPEALLSTDRFSLCRPACSQCEARMLVSEEGSEQAQSVSVSASATASSVSVVSCYRAVPVLVSAVPTISCLNVSHVNVEAGVSPTRGRTFTSTEAQTDDIGVAPSTPPNNNREQRRRERRERRQQRRVNNNPTQIEPHWQTLVAEQPTAPGGGERLPDILNSHLPPPYSTLPLGLPPPGHVVHPHLHQPPPPPPVPPPVPVPVPVTTAVPGSPPPHHHHGGMRFPFQITPGGRRRSRRSPRGQHYTPEQEPKSCCGVVVTQAVSIRWFIVIIAVVGVCCAVVGTVLGAMRASGREHLTVSLLLIGVGIVLITVSGVAWRLTAHDAPSCRMMLGLGGGDEGGAEPNRRFVPRLPPSYGRPHHPYAAMMYPEFQYRPPPPSYQASMQEYRLRLLLLDRHPGSVAPGGHAVSPPPTYRSHAGSTLRAPLGMRRDQPQSDYSRPPSYRSRTSSTRPTLDPNGNTGCSTAEHSRDPSLSLSESGGGSGIVNVISVVGSGVPEPEPLDNIKLTGLSADQDIPLRMMTNKGSCHSSLNSDGKDGNLVTIVQTGDDSSPVIVTVSGSMVGSSTSQLPATGIVDTEMEILAHL